MNESSPEDTSSASQGKGLDEIDLENLTPWLRKLWEEKFEFSKKQLQLSDEKAREWASRTVNVLIQCGGTAKLD